MKATLLYLARCGTRLLEAIGKMFKTIHRQDDLHCCNRFRKMQKHRKKARRNLGNLGNVLSCILHHAALLSFLAIGKIRR